MVKVVTPFLPFLLNFHFLYTINNQEIVLDHFNNIILLNNELIWHGESNRYTRVYRNLLERISKNTSNIEIGLQESEIIKEIFEFRE